jgi:hypothetical protein
MADNDPVTKEAEEIIARRVALRRGVAPEMRNAAALEQIADDMTRLSAEIRALRRILATYAAPRLRKEEAHPPARTAPAYAPAKRGPKPRVPPK